jgi:membrane-associated phospholipid phosphatase
MTKKIVLMIMVFITCYSSGHCQEAKEEKDTLHDYCAICTNHQHLIIKPPYTRKFKKELPFILASGAMFGAGLVFDAVDKTKPYTEEELRSNPLDPNSINSFDRKAIDNWSPSIGKASDYVLLTVSILPALFLSEHHTERDIKTLAVMYAEVFTFNYGLTEIAKKSVNRPRPYVYNPDTTVVPISSRTDASSRESFWSGHTSQTAAASFFFAKVITDYHPNLRPGLKTGMWIFAATVPALNGYLRVQAGKHFPTDVITGYITGAATGWLIPQLHRTRTSKEAKAKLDMGLVPYKDGMMMSLSLNL